MKKSEMQNPLQSLYEVFAKSSVRPTFKGGLPIGSEVKIRLEKGGVPLVREEEFRSGDTTLKFLAFDPCGISVKSFCERGRVLGPNGEDLTASCNDVPQVITNMVRAWISQFQGDDVDDFMRFKVTKTDTVERYGRNVTVYTYQMVAVVTQPAQAGAPF